MEIAWQEGWNQSRYACSGVGSREVDTGERRLLIYYGIDFKKVTMFKIMGVKFFTFRKWNLKYRNGKSYYEHSDDVFNVNINV